MKPLLAIPLALPLLAVGAAPDKKPHIGDLRMGEYWHGAQVSLDDLEGKVVLMEYWGS